MSTIAAVRSDAWSTPAVGQKLPLAISSTISCSQATIPTFVGYASETQSKTKFLVSPTSP
jgi:hypothetical protein